MTSQIEITTFLPEYADGFAHLNYQWIEKHFEVEPYDRKVLDAPEEQILAKGGEIFFAVHEGKPVGTVALLPLDDDSFELTKMAVAPSFRGKQLGKRLMLRAIEHATKVGKKHLIILSNTLLVPAINLYIDFGFRPVVMENEAYSRANIKMAKKL
ncbi:MAG: GNAT family N-acetyltransferase [Myxococcales bacterium]|nr:GNAT family N-acetyltransferase [Myxococcales bacterium]MCB9644332.1 GNAT family N-acetyltransferase [Myxococcales bacterium]